MGSYITVGYIPYASSKAGGSIGCFFRHGYFGSGALSIFGQEHPFYFNNGGLFVDGAVHKSVVRNGWRCGWDTMVPLNIVHAKEVDYQDISVDIEQLMEIGGARQAHKAVRCVPGPERVLLEYADDESGNSVYRLLDRGSVAGIGIGRITMLYAGGLQEEDPRLFCDMSAHKWLDNIARPDRSIRWVPVVFRG